MIRKYNFYIGILAESIILLLKKWEIIYQAFILLIVLMSIDYISGMVASKKESLEHPNSKKYGWNSTKGLLGIYKKAGYIFTILVAICTDYVIFIYIEKMGLETNNKTFFGLLVVIWFILNETLSILENVGRMGVKLPQFLVNAISSLKDDIDKKS